MAVFIKGKTKNLVLFSQKSGKVGKYKYYILIYSIYIKPNSTLLLCSLYGVRNRIAYAPTPSSSTIPSSEDEAHLGLADTPQPYQPPSA